MSWTTYEAVAAALGHAYDVHPAWLRPKESLKKLFDLDSWDLGEGTEAFEERIRMEFDIAELNPPPKTLLDLLVAVERRARERATRDWHVPVAGRGVVGEADPDRRDERNGMRDR